MKTNALFSALILLVVCVQTATGSFSFSEQHKEPPLYYFGAGKRFLQKKDYRSALKNFQIAYRLNNKLIEARFFTGTIYLQRGLYRFALDEFQFVINNSKDLTLRQLKYDAALLAARCHFILGRNTDPDIDANPHFINAKKILNRMIKDASAEAAALQRITKPGWFFYHNYYLARAYYVLARLNRAINRHDLYVRQFEQTVNHIRQLLQTDASLSTQELIQLGRRELTSLYFLYIRAYHTGNKPLAAKIKVEATGRISSWETFIKNKQLTARDLSAAKKLVIDSKNYFSGAGRPPILVLYSRNNTPFLQRSLNNGIN